MLNRVHNGRDPERNSYRNTNVWAALSGSGNIHQIESCISAKAPQKCMLIRLYAVSGCSPGAKCCRVSGPWLRGVRPEKWGRWSRSGSGLKDSCGLRRPRSKLPLGGSRCIANSLLLLRMIRASQLKREDIIHLHLSQWSF